MVSVFSRKKKYWILIALIVLLSGYVGVHVYLKYLNSQPLSTRGLPMPVTDVPIILPPDPGEAGKATLAGIDSDNDGVRDDLQREIVYMYPQSEEVRRVLRAMVKKEQQLITTSGDHEYFKGIEISYLALKDCYEFLSFGTGLVDFSKGDAIWNMGKNTSERKRNLENNHSKATPFSSTIYGTSEACTQPLVKGQY